jgi:quinol monooxygenase YgiN
MKLIEGWWSWSVWRWLALFSPVVLGSSQACAQPSGAAAGETCCTVLELRQYTLYPGKRDVLIDLFDREFIESQEAVGAHVVGQFRDLDNPDRFVWLRGFTDMNSRLDALQAFYGGPVWKAHRDQANATMMDSSNVLLLQRATLQSGFPAAATPRPPVGTKERPTSLMVATIYYLKNPVGDDFIQFFERTVKPLMTEMGARPIAYFETETAENNFPKLPVRTGENVFVWFSSFQSQDEYARHSQRLEGSKSWNDTVLPELSRYMKASTEHLRLQPTERSLLR